MTAGGRRLSGEVVVVTGAGSGIGRSAARACAAEGAAVAVADRDLAAAAQTVDAIREEGSRGLALELDVTDPEMVETGFRRVEAQLGPVSGLFNNAAVALPADGAVTDLDPAAWDVTLRVNLTGPVLCMQQAIPQMSGRGGGSIVNNVSVAALVAEPGLDAYTAAKGGLLALTRSVAASFAAQGIRSNAICPGLVRTPLTRRVSSPMVERFERETLLPIGEPEDVSGLVVYLLSTESRYVTGATMVIDGGYTAR